MSEPAWIPELVELVGAECVVTEEAELRRYGFDQYPLAVKWKSQGLQPYRPDAILRPATTGQVSRLLSWASERRIPVTP